MVTITAERVVPASPADTWYALTHAWVLRAWLCDHASLVPRPGGRLYLWWHGGGAVCGECTAVEPDRSLGLEWHGRGESASGRVQIDLAPDGGGTRVSVSHDLPEGTAPELAGRRESEWNEALGNLAYTLETGLDRRIQERPLLGIYVAEFNPTVARSIGVPVTEGMRLEGVTEGLGAAAAGLRRNDVLVEVAGRAIGSDFSSFVGAMEGKRGGDRVEVAFYRGPELRRVTMELSRRPVPEIPRGAAALTEAVRARKAEDLAALEKCLDGVDAGAAARRPADGGWNATEILAHLVHGERGTISYVVELVGGHERIADDYAGNLDAAVRATVAAYPTVSELLDALRRLAVESGALAAGLPAEFVERTCTYVPAAQQLLDTERHALGHVPQIEAAIRG